MSREDKQQFRLTIIPILTCVFIVAMLAFVATIFTGFIMALGTTFGPVGTYMGILLVSGALFIFSGLSLMGMLDK